MKPLEGATGPIAEAGALVSSAKFLLRASVPLAAVVWAVTPTPEPIKLPEALYDSAVKSSYE